MQLSKKTPIEEHNDLISKVKIELKNSRGKHYRDVKKHYDKLIHERNIYLRIHPKDIEKEVCA